MTLVKRSTEDGIAILSLAHGTTNPIAPDLVASINAALDDVEEEGSCRGVVLTSENRKFFSIGFDLPTLYPMGRAEMREFFHNFNTLSLRLFTLGLPTMCAMPGHATAGGCILALMCDYRYIAEGRKLIGLNEVKLALPVPFLPDQVLRMLVRERDATELLYTGEFLDPAAALAVRLVDGVFPADDLLSAAIRKTTSLGNYDREAFAVMKQNRVGAVQERYERSRVMEEKIFLRLWFGEAARVQLSEALKKY